MLSGRRPSAQEANQIDFCAVKAAREWREYTVMQEIQNAQSESAAIIAILAKIFIEGIP